MLEEETSTGQPYKWCNKSSILITGGGGYLGSYLAKSLCQYDCQVFLLDIKFNDISKSLNEKHENVYLENIDLTDKILVNNICESIKPDYIYHFAASLDRSRDFDIYTKSYQINVGILQNLLMALRYQDYKGFYLSSTSELYGNIDNPPFYEDQKISPVSPYSLTKAMAEYFLSSFSLLHNKPYTIMRIFNFFGPNQPSATFVGEMIKACLKNEVFKMSKGEQERDYLYVDELIEQIIHVSSLKEYSGIYNLCSGRGVFLNDIAAELVKLSNNNFQIEKSLPYRDNEIMKIIGSNKKLLSTGYELKNLNLNKAIKKCIALN